MIARAPRDAFGERLETYRGRVDARLERALGDDAGFPERLHAAMRYAVLGTGKRVRPLLVYASAEACDVEPARVDTIAAAVELVHAYSLVHDDLPSMDDDDLRRGLPTTHREFDEGTAILAGDALQALAFEILCEDAALTEYPAAQTKAIGWLARAIGPAGMVGGQALDLAAEGCTLTESDLENIHRRKTGQLIRAAIMMPSELGPLDDEQRGRLDVFANDIGLVFQIRDDLLEIEQSTETLGKNAGSDATNAKSTYPSVLGLDGARERAEAIYRRAVDSLESIGCASDGLTWLSDYILTRPK